MEFDGIVAACGLYIQVGDEVIKNILLAEEILEKVKRTIIKKIEFFPVFEGCSIFITALSMHRKKNGIDIGISCRQMQIK